MIRQIVLLSVGLCLSTAPGAAQFNPFQTALTVNGIGISHYDLDQRRRLLSALNTTGDLTRQAEDALISERLYLEEAERLALDVDQEDIDSGISEFAARAALTSEQFLNEIAKFGVTEESFTAFVRAGVAWRKVIRARFSPNVALIDIFDVEQSLAFQPPPTITSVRLSEIALSLRPSAAERSRDVTGQISRTVASADEFADVARSLSIANTREEGGSIGWIPLSRLPVNAQSAIRATPAGQITRPVETENAIFVFFKHEVREESSFLLPEITEYAVLRIAPEGDQTARQRAMTVISRVDGCDDLRSISRGFPRGHFRANSVSADAGPGLYALQLDRLDSGESEVLPIKGSEAVELLMVCGRRASLPEEQREAVLNQKRDEKLAEYASIFLANLRASAIIIK